MTKLVFDGAVNAAKGAKLNSKSGRAAAEGQQGVDPLTGAALAAPVQGAPQAKVGAVPTVAGKANPKVEAVKIVKQDDDAKDEKLHKDGEGQPTSQGEHLAMVDAASAAAVGVMTTETVAAQGDGGSSDGGDGGEDSTPLIIGGLVLVGGGIAAAASGGGDNKTVTPPNTAPTFAAASQAVNAAENAAITTVVAKSTATDTAGDTLTYSLGGADAALFNINAATGEITFKASPNFEVKADAGANGVYDVVVTAKDAGGLTATQNVAITVTNVNEAPTYAAATATANFAENTAAATVVITAAATDVDAGDTLSYTLGGADAALFDINAATGAITFKASPNFEAPGDAGANNVYDVVVTAKDAAGLSTTQAVAITVTNVNEAPVITSGATATVAENAAIATVVYDANATDVDAGQTLVYSLGGADAAAFDINATTGEVTLKASADFETKPSYAITVTATDSANPALSVTQAVAVTVTDVNEAPVISSNGGGATAAVSVAENTTAVTTVTSTDVDAGASRTFAISGGADAALFTINATTGVLSFVAAPNFEAPADAGTNNVYDVVVQVTDNGNPGLTDSQAIAVTVTNVIEPVDAVNDSFAVNEGATLNGTVATNDTLEGVVTFNLVNPGAPPAGLTFTAGSSTGAFIFNANDAAYNSLALGATQNVTFDYTVTNGTTTDTATATIVVTGTNDAAVIAGATTAAVTEDTAVNGQGSLVAQGVLTVTDVDTGEATFQAQNGTVGTFGTFSLLTNGTYTYTAANNNAAIQALNTGQSATDTFQVQSADGTTSNVVITINGLNEPVIVNLDVDTDANPGTPVPINAALDAFLFTDSAAISNSVIITGFGAGDSFSFTDSTRIGADPSSTWFSAAGRDLIINYNGGGTTNQIVIDEVLNPGTVIFGEADANAALNLALGTSAVDYFQIA